MVFNMATPDDAAFEKEFGSYRPAATSVPIRTIRPILGGESPEAAAARKAKEGREVSGETRDEERLRLAQEAADAAARGEGRAVEDTKRKAFLDLVTKYEGDDRVVKYQKVLPIFNTMLTVASRANPSKADDNLMVTYFSKIKDPSTGVLGGEYETAKNVQTAYDKALVDLQGLYDPKIGFVSPEARKQFIRATRDLVASDRIAYDAARNRYGAFAKNPLFGVNPEEVIGQDFAETYRDQIKEKFLTVMGGAEAETAGGVPVLKVAEGDKFSTDKDIAIASELQGMWAAGRPLDEVNAKAIELTGGNPLSAETVKALSEDPQRTIRFTPNRSGIREGSASQIGPVEAAGAAAVRGYTSNLGEEILSTVFNSPEAAAKLQAAGEAGMESNPLISALFEIPSSIASPLNKFTKFIPGGPVVRDIVEGGIYGGGEGRPDASALERAKTAAAGGILQSGFGAAARRFMPGGAAPDGTGIPEGEFVNVTGEVPAGMVPDIGVGGQATRSPSEFGMPTGAPSGMAPPTAGMAAPVAGEVAADVAAEISTEGMIELAQKAVSRGPGASKARAQLAEMAKTNPEAKSAADRLGLELPVDVLSDNSQLKEVVGLTRAQIGSEAKQVWNETVQAASERAHKAMDELDAVTDISQVSADVFNQLDNAQMGLGRKAGALRDEVTDSIDAAGAVTSDKIKSYLQERIRLLGGGKKGIMNLSGEEKKLWSAISKDNPTYTALNEYRDMIGQALENGTGPWSNTNRKRLKDIYGALADDQINFIEASAGKEIADKQRAANTLFKQMYEGREQMERIFTKNLSGSLAPLMQRAITQGTKGNVQTLNTLVKIIPENMRGTVLTSALFKAAKATDETFSFTNFANIYRDLRANSAVYKQVAEAVGPEGDKLLTDLYAVSRRLSDADKAISRTGASNQLQLLNSERLLSRILMASGGAAGAGLIGSVLGGPGAAIVGAGLAAAAPEIAQRLGKTNAQKLHNLISSEPFRDLTVSAATGDALERNINRVAGSKEFSDYAKLVGIDMKDARNWLNSAIAKGATIGGTEAVGSKPDEAPTVEMPQ
jgi:hypothetical protein